MLGLIVSVHKKVAMTWNPVEEPAFDIQSSEQVCRSWLTALYELSCDRLPTSPGWSPRACFFCARLCVAQTTLRLCCFWIRRFSTRRSHRLILQGRQAETAGGDVHEAF